MRPTKTLMPQIRLATGDIPVFDFTDAVAKLIRHIVAGCPELAHIDPDRILVSHLRTRSPGPHGVYASVQPLKFEGGSPTTRRRGRIFAMPTVTHEGREILYIIYFALPRFADLDFNTKLITVFHELYHISPEFNGDIRRFPGRNYAHGHSRKRYNERLQSLVDRYLATPDALQITSFLRLNYSDLLKHYGRVVATRVRPPRPKPV